MGAQALNGVPSVGVVNASDKKLRAIISQGHFMKAVVNSGVLSSTTVTVGNLHNQGKTPQKVDQAAPTEQLLTVLDKMGQQNRSSYAIVDKAGKFCGALTIKDTKAFKKMTKDSAKTSVAKYLEAQTDTALTCQANETVVSILGKICSKKSHRTFLLDGNGKLVSVLALTDVIRLVSNTTRK